MANQYNANGKKEGLWVKYYESGAVKEERVGRIYPSF